MTDAPPEVDFSRPYSHLEGLVAQRRYVRSIAEDIRGSLRDVDRYQAEAVNAASIAAAWAATLMVCDLVTIGLKAGDRRARVLFGALERAIGQARTVMQLFGAPVPPTKADIMRALDDDLRTGTKITGAIRETRDFLSKLKLPTTQGPTAVRLPKELNLVVDLATALADDTLLILQAGQTQERAIQQAASARVQMRSSLNRVLQRLMLIDSEITREVERLQLLSRTA